jgi:hypothetical protein
VLEWSAVGWEWLAWQVGEGWGLQDVARAVAMGKGLPWERGLGRERVWEVSTWGLCNQCSRQARQRLS